MLVNVQSMIAFCLYDSAFRVIFSIPRLIVSCCVLPDTDKSTTPRQTTAATATGRPFHKALYFVTSRIIMDYFQGLNPNPNAGQGTGGGKQRCRGGRVCGEWWLGVK